MGQDLEKLSDEWGRLGIVDSFKAVHHFSRRPQFKTRPPNLVTFITWCSSREIRDENRQTLKRGLRVAELVANGETISEAIRAVWKTHQLVTREGA